MDIGCKFGFLRVSIIAYADDIVLLANNKDNLGLIYEEFKTKIELRKLIINKNKSKCMVFRRGRQTCNERHITLGSDSLEMVNNYKYLGHFIESNLTDATDIQVRLNSFYSKFNYVFRNFKDISMDVFFFIQFLL